MILYINTKEQNRVEVVLHSVQGKPIKSLSAQNKFGSQALLPLIVKILNCADTRLPDGQASKVDIRNIEVETGPGSFTGLRVGVSVANALGFALNIPVNGKKMETDLIY